MRIGSTPITQSGPMIARALQNVAHDRRVAVRDHGAMQPEQYAVSGNAALSCDRISSRES